MAVHAMSPLPICTGVSAIRALDEAPGLNIRGPLADILLGFLQGPAEALPVAQWFVVFADHEVLAPGIVRGANDADFAACPFDDFLKTACSCCTVIDS